jgi:hypothetical protein
MENTHVKRFRVVQYTMAGGWYKIEVWRWTKLVEEWSRPTMREALAELESRGYEPQ